MKRAIKYLHPGTRIVVKKGRIHLAMCAGAINESAVKRELGDVEGITGKKSPHVLRHTLATELLDEGTDLYSIKELLGHSSLAATQVYTHNTVEKLKKVYANAHPRAKRGGKHGD